MGTAEEVTPSAPSQVRAVWLTRAFRIGIAVVVVVVVTLASTWNPLFHRHLSVAFPAKVHVAFFGKTGTAIVGSSSVVGVDGEPDVRFRLTITPTSKKPITILGLAIRSSDRMGRNAGGGLWDTYDDNTRALGVVRGGQVINLGPKRPLKIKIDRSTALDLYIADGTMTKFWKYFTLRIEVAGGLFTSIVMEGSSWRVMSKDQ